MYLLIDVSVYKEIRLALFSQHTTTQESILPGNNTLLLQYIDQLLAASLLTPQDIHGIAVVIGAGSFSSTRVAVTVANAWCYAMQIPIVGITQAQSADYAYMAAQLASQPLGVYISATYSAEPDIGTPKKKQEKAQNV